MVYFVQITTEALSWLPLDFSRKRSVWLSWLPPPLLHMSLTSTLKISCPICLDALRILAWMPVACMYIYSSKHKQMLILTQLRPITSSTDKYSTYMIDTSPDQFFCAKPRHGPESQISMRAVSSKVRNTTRSPRRMYV